MKMSELGPDVSTREQYQFSYNHLTLESTMAKLHIGQPNSSSKGFLNLDSKKLADCTELMFPDFWRRTLSNPIAGHKDTKNFCKKKVVSEILRPARLKLPIQRSSGGNTSNAEAAQDPAAASTSAMQKPDEVLVVPSHLPNSISAELYMNGYTPTIVTLPDFSSLSIRNSCKKNVAIKTIRGRPRLWRSSKSKSRISSLKDYRSLRNTLPPIPEVDVDEEEQQSISAVETYSTQFGLSRSSNLDIPTACPPLAVSQHQSCSQQALMETTDDITIDELASYLDVIVNIPKKMSPLAEYTMYT